MRTTQRAGTLGLALRGRREDSAPILPGRPGEGPGRKGVEEGQLWDSNLVPRPVAPRQARRKEWDQVHLSSSEMPGPPPRPRLPFLRWEAAPPGGVGEKSPAA